jgi:hypothetical protein
MRAAVVDASALAAVPFDDPEAAPIVASVSGRQREGRRAPVGYTSVHAASVR